MWKRLNFSNRTREALADNPSPPPEDEFKSRPYEIPSLQFEESPNPAFAKHAKKPSEVPTVAASSIYSDANRTSMYWHDGGPNISPPDSPHWEPHHPDDGRVSPVAETSEIPRYSVAASSRYSTYIPVRKPAPGTQIPGPGGRLTPGNPYYIPSGIENIPPSSSSQAAKRGIFAGKVPNIGGKFAKPREPWRGASGRTTLVEPVRDTPQEPRIAIPPRNPNRISPAGTPTQELDPEPDYGFRTPQPPYLQSNDTRERLEHVDTLAALTARRESDAEPSESRFSWSTHATGTTYRTTLSHETGEPPSPPPPMPTNMPEILRKSAGTTLDMSGMRVAPPPFPPAKQESVLDRKRPIPKDDVPTTPLTDSPPTFHSRISTARKPVGVSGSPMTSGPGRPTNLSVQPVSSNDDATSPIARSPSSTLTSNDRKLKDLPPAPSILESTKDKPADHVDLLRSQIDDLAHRRQNIQRAIHNLTAAQSGARNPMVTDWRAAKEGEIRIGKLRDELADINREDHELGLKLHRAYKRREREGEMAGTSALWVRRVTS